MRVRVSAHGTFQIERVRAGVTRHEADGHVTGLSPMANAAGLRVREHGRDLDRDTRTREAVPPATPRHGPAGRATTRARTPSGPDCSSLRLRACSPQPQGRLRVALAPPPFAAGPGGP